MPKTDMTADAAALDPVLKIHLRMARADDALCLGVLATQVWLDTYAKPGIRTSFAHYVRSAFASETISALIARPEVCFTVAEHEGNLVGFAQCTLGVDEPLVKSLAPAELDRLYVQEPFTNTGLGKRLIAYAEAECAARGAMTLWLHTWIGNARALAFYAKRGYLDVGSMFFEMDGERHENRVFAKALEVTR